jgi:hypothetical protein
VIGGAGGIRTLDRALQPYNGLANRRLQPLGHSSVTADMPDTASCRKRQISGCRILRHLKASGPIDGPESIDPTLLPGADPHCRQARHACVVRMSQMRRRFGRPFRPQAPAHHFARRFGARALVRWRRAIRKNAAENIG